jgi:hypothetical protein
VVREGDPDPLGSRSGERELLTGTLDWYRAVAERKVLGLDDATAKQARTPSGLSPLGIVQHLGWVERMWFVWRFAGRDVELRLGEGNYSVQFELDPGATVDSVVAFYRAEVEAARHVVDGLASLDELSVREHPNYGLVNLRWLLVHMIEETARHTGHLDVMRESIDGSTGD